MALNPEGGVGAHIDKALFDRVQEIVWEQEPFLYLVDKDALVAVSPSVQNAHPVVLQPQTFWNAEYLSVK